jgi:hypothetical protein
VVERDAAGCVRKVHVWDFKTDRVEDRAQAERAAARYFGQLDLYRSVAARLTGVAAIAVDATLVFTAISVLVGVSPTPGKPSRPLPVGN